MDIVAQLRSRLELRQLASATEDLVTSDYNDRIEVGTGKQGHHHNDDHAARRPHFIICSICSRQTGGIGHSFLGRRCYSIVWYSACRIGMRGRDFDCPNPQIFVWSNWGGGQNLTLELRPNGSRYRAKFCIERYWEVGGWAFDLCANPLTFPNP